MTESEEPEKAGSPEGDENVSPAEAGRSEEPGPAQPDEVTRAASEADPSSSPHGDELEEAVAAGAPEASDEGEAPKRPRRRRRRRAEPEAAAPADEAPADAEGAQEPEAAAEVQEPEAAPEIAEPVAAESAEAEIAEEPAEDEAEAEAEAPAAPARPTRTAPRRRRRERDPDLPPPVVRAQARYVRSSARKARLVCDHIRGKSVEEARAILALTPRAIASDWSKLLESAVANAEHNHELVGEDLYVKSVHADEGPTIKRFRPRAMGRATRIRKRTSHLTILLTPKD
jgi:ribosomal protein L22